MTLRRCMDNELTSEEAKGLVGNFIWWSKIINALLTKLKENSIWSSERELLCFTETKGSSRPEVFLLKGILKICTKFTGERPCRSVISIKLLCNFIEIALRHGCSHVNLLHIFRTPFYKGTFGRLLPNKLD